MPPFIYRLVRAVGEKASHAGLPLYLVGGPVRDLLLGRPMVDLDLVVEGDASTLAFEVAKELGGEVISYHRFGTASVKIDQQRLDIATARHETYPRAGALPSVTPSSIEEDLKRRDFTINAIAITLSGPKLYRLLDPTGGRLDLERRLLRVLHDGSFRDDATRILRAARFEQRLSFRLESKTHQLLLRAVEEGMLTTVSADRLRRETELILREERPDLILARAGELGLMSGLHNPLGNVSWLKALTYPEGKREPLEYLAALAHPLTAEEGEAFIARLNMSSRWATVIRDAISLRETEKRLREPALSTTLLCQLLDRLSPASITARASLTSDPLVRQRLEQYLDHLRHVKPRLTGKDLLALGYPQGPRIGQILHRLRAARLEGRLVSRQQEVDLAKQCLVG